MLAEVRFIRALRLAEYAKKPEMEQLRVLLDRFYREDYSVWQGELDQYREQGNAEENDPQKGEGGES